jgi:hypothetical protein
MLRRFPIRQNDSKGKPAKKAVAPIPVVIETCKGYPRNRSSLADSSWTVSSWLSNTSKKNPYVCRLGLEPVKKVPARPNEIGSNNEDRKSPKRKS